MTDNSFRIDPSSVRSVASTFKAIPLEQAPEGLFNQIVEAQREMLRNDYTTPPETEGNPAYAPYATITVNGKMVAQIDNHGWVRSSNAKADMVGLAIEQADQEVGNLEGPALAQARAEKIAALLNGKITLEPTAQTQQAYARTPKPTPTFDAEAMMKDPRYTNLQSLCEAHTAFLAQQINQSAGT